MLRNLTSEFGERYSRSFNIFISFSSICIESYYKMNGESYSDQTRSFDFLMRTHFSRVLVGQTAEILHWENSKYAFWYGKMFLARENVSTYLSNFVISGNIRNFDENSSYKIHKLCMENADCRSLHLGNFWLHFLTVIDRPTNYFFIEYSRTKTTILIPNFTM